MNQIVPELRTTVVQHVLDQEDEGAVLGLSLVKTSEWRMSNGVIVSVYRVTFNYSQKLKKTKEKFDFRSCILDKY